MAASRTPEVIIQELINRIDVETDLSTLEGMEETIRSINLIRKSKISELSSTNERLQQTISHLESEIAALNSVNDYNYEIISNLTTFKELSEAPPRTDGNIFKLLNKKSIELDNLKVSIAKSLNDLESSINSLKLSRSNLANDLDKSRDRISQLENEPAKITDSELLNQDSSVLKINLFRNLGVRIENFEESGPDQVVIHNKASSLSSVLKVDEKYSDYFISNYIWDRLEGVAE